MAYIHPESARYPLSEQEIRSEFPNTSFCTPFIPPEGYEWVFPTPTPEYNSVLEFAEEVYPVFTDKNVWEQSWRVESRYFDYTDDIGVLHTKAEQEAAAIQADVEAKAQALMRNIEAQAQQRLDDFARTRHYDDIKSASDYAGDIDPIFNAEGTYCKQVRSQTWRTLINIMTAVQTGARAMPTGFADIEPELPVLAWPE